MIAKEMVSVRQVALQLGVDESTLRYRLGRSVDTPDGRMVRATVMVGWDKRVDAVLHRFERCAPRAGRDGPLCRADSAWDAGPGARLYRELSGRAAVFAAAIRHPAGAGRAPHRSRRVADLFLAE